MQFRGFSIFTKLYNNHHYLLLEHFHYPERNLYPLAVTSHSSLSPAPGNH